VLYSEEFQGDAFLGDQPHAWLSVTISEHVSGWQKWIA